MNHASHFLALDVETANADMSSICQIGFVEFRDGGVCERWSSLVNPEAFFDSFNIAIHGITRQMVQHSPRFPEIHKQLQLALASCIVVTHTHFDQTSLHRAAQRYKLPELTCTWLDSARVVRRQWEQFRHEGYGLPNLAQHFHIEYKAHDAADDALAAGLVVLRALEESQLTIEAWVERAHQSIPSPSGSVVQAGNPDGPFYGECIAFTGALGIPRHEAAQLAAMAGCNVSAGPTKNTTVLVVGTQDMDKLVGYAKSSKHRKAEQLIAEGQALRIITEADFLEMIQSGTRV